jgi:hypothetical protein
MIARSEQSEKRVVVAKLSLKNRVTLKKLLFLEIRLRYVARITKPPPFVVPRVFWKN